MDMLYSCHLCKNRVPRSEIRYSRDGSRLVCRECYANCPGAPGDEERPVPKEHEFRGLMDDLEPLDTSEFLPKAGAGKSAEGTQASKRVIAVHGESVEKKQSRRVTYLCIHCRYRFTLGKKSSVMRRCPYCGKAELLEVTDISMQEFIPH